MSTLVALALAAAMNVHPVASYGARSFGGYRSYSRPSYSRPSYSAPIRRSAPAARRNIHDEYTSTPQMTTFPWWVFYLNNRPLPECDDVKPGTKCRLPRPE